jgi:FecR-like protein
MILIDSVFFSIGEMNMKGLTQLLVLSFVLMFSMSSGLTAGGFAAEDSIGTVNMKKRPVWVKRGSKTMSVGSSGLELKKGDVVKTEKGGQAEINLKSGNNVYVASSSEIELTEEVIGQGKTGVVSIVKLFFGKIRARIQKTRQKRFRVKTTTATIGVKGTDFVTEYVDKKTTVGTLDGLVSLTSDKTRQSVDIPKGKMSSVSAFGELLPLEEFAGDLLKGVEFAGEKMAEDDFAGGKITF